MSLNININNARKLKHKHLTFVEYKYYIIELMKFISITVYL